MVERERTRTGESMSADELRERVAAREWYHTIDLPGGVTTPGFFDHRPVLANYDLPDRLDGLRVLDVGTFDGYFAFEFERRGAREVIGLDVPDVESLDWPAPLRRDPNATTRFQPQHDNFTIAREALNSTVRREFVSVYDVTTDRLGEFDYVFVGSVLIHLRDPVGALMALLRVCRGTICIAEESQRRLDLLSRRTGLAKFQALSPHLTWWIPNTACWRQFLLAAGFVDVQIGSTFTIPFRGGHKRGVRHVVLTAKAP